MGEVNEKYTRIRDPITVIVPPGSSVDLSASRGQQIAGNVSQATAQARARSGGSSTPTGGNFSGADGSIYQVDYKTEKPTYSPDANFSSVTGEQLKVSYETSKAPRQEVRQRNKFKEFGAAAAKTYLLDVREAERIRKEGTMAERLGAAAGVTAFGAETIITGGGIVKAGVRGGAKLYGKAAVKFGFKAASREALRESEKVVIKKSLGARIGISAVKVGRAIPQALQGANIIQAPSYFKVASTAEQRIKLTGALQTQERAYYGGISNIQVKQAAEGANFAEKAGVFVQNTPAYGKGLVNTIGYGLARTIPTLRSSERQKFRTGLSGELNRQGLTNSDTTLNNLMRFRRAQGFGDVFRNLRVSAAGEEAGQVLVSRSFAKSAGKTIPVTKSLFFKTGVPIAGAGLFEGGSVEFTRQVANQEKLNFKAISSSAIIGGASAGLLGGYIANKEIKAALGQGKRPNIVKGLAYITDPYELPGDIAYARAIAPFRRSLGKDVFEPGILSKVSVPTLSLTTSLTGTKTSANTRTQTKGKPNVNPFVRVNGQVFPSIFAPTNTPANTPIESPSNIPTDTDKIINTNTRINTETNINVGTPTTTNTFIFTPVTTTTPLLRMLPPILPFNLGGSGGGYGGTRKGKKTYLNELDVGLKTIKSFSIAGVFSKSKKTNTAQLKKQTSDFKKIFGRRLK
jgi:hypothetical protein